MWLSSTAQTALRAAVHIASRPTDRPVRAEEIAAELDCPRNYLSKTLHVLARAGVLHSARGPKGGFRLVDPPSVLTLATVVAPFAPVAERRCLMGRPTCGVGDPCPAHEHWSEIAAGVETYFNETTVADLLGGGRRSRSARAGTPQEAPHARSAR